MTVAEEFEDAKVDVELVFQDGPRHGEICVQHRRIPSMRDLGTMIDGYEIVRARSRPPVLTLEYRQDGVQASDRSTQNHGST